MADEDDRAIHVGEARYSIGVTFEIVRSSS